MNNKVYIVIEFLTSEMSKTTNVLSVFRRKEDAQKEMKERFLSELEYYKNDLKNIEINQDETSSTIDYMEGEEIVEISIFEKDVN